MVNMYSCNIYAVYDMMPGRVYWAVCICILYMECICYSMYIIRVNIPELYTKDV